MGESRQTITKISDHRGIIVLRPPKRTFIFSRAESFVKRSPYLEIFSRFFGYERFKQIKKDCFQITAPSNC